MKELIAAWGKEIERLVTADRGHTKFKHAVELNEYVHVMGHDSSILEIVLGCGAGIYMPNRYTRVVWSERNPPETPFAYESYESKEYPDKSKQEFHNAVRYGTAVPEYLTAAQVARRLGL